MISAFLQAAIEIINQEGIEQVSIRKVAKTAGFNSATIYLYFQDADELITMASIGYLEEYCRLLSETPQQNKSPYEVYLYTWTLFCRYAFTHPHVFYRLFYHPHRKPLNHSLQIYYEIFPELLENISSPLLEILHEGNLCSRNMKALLPLAQKNLICQEDIPMINDLILCFFRKLLEEQCQQKPAHTSEEQTQRFLQAARFLLKN